VKAQGNLAAIKVPTDWFGACLTGGDVRHKKPHPEIFLAAARQLGSPPAACLVVEDAPNGVRAAKAAGAACLGLTSSFSNEQLREQGADWTAADLAHVPQDLLARLGLT
ncbi:MAG: HAD family hydrolase, partial [Kiritimatiellia bacterium]